MYVLTIFSYAQRLCVCRTNGIFRLNLVSTTSSTRTVRHNISQGISPCDVILLSLSNSMEERVLRSHRDFFRWHYSTKERSYWLGNEARKVYSLKAYVGAQSKQLGIDAIGLATKWHEVNLESDSSHCRSAYTQKTLQRTLVKSMKGVPSQKCRCIREPVNHRTSGMG